MKKIILIMVLLLSLLGVKAQEKGLYLTAGGSLGANTFRYTLDNDNVSTPRLGFGGSLGVQYFFTKHWGVATGLGLTFYNTKGKYSNSWDNDPNHYSFSGMYDDDFRNENNELDNYTLRLSLNNWEEIQKAYFLEIPLMLMYQTKWGVKQDWGMYAGIGVKVQIPVFGEKYSVSDKSELTVGGYYDNPYLPLENIPYHGYGTTDKTGYEGDLALKTSFAATGEIGFLRTLSRRVDLSLGIYLDYGFNNIKDGNKVGNEYLLNPENGAKTIHPSDYIGDNIQYNGYMNSYAVDKVNLLALGGKVGIRIKLGKLSQDDQKQTPQDTLIAEVKRGTYIYNIWVRDSLTKQPILTEAVLTCTDCPVYNDHNFYSSEQHAVPKELYPNKTYKVNLTKYGFAPYSTEFITKPNEFEINILMPLHPNLTGIVRSTNNAPLSESQITVTTGNGKTYKAVTDPDGRFTIPSVDAGMRYTVLAEKIGYIPDSVYLDIPSEPNMLQPSYTVENELGKGIRLKPIKKMTLSALVLFDLDKHNLRPEAKSEIDQIIPMLKENPQIMVEVGGHTDSRGTAAYNRTLSAKRASSVRSYMISQGIDASRIRARGYGFSKLVNKCKQGVKCTEAEHQENRRVEFIFSERIIVVE